MLIREKRPAPIIVYVYNRPDHFNKCIDALAANPLADRSELYVVSDGAACSEHEQAVNQVREIALAAKGFFKVHPMFRETNWGVYASATAADREVVENHGRMICLEDDVITAPTFLEFINSGLEFYEQDQRIYSISGYCHTIQFPASYRESFWLSLVHNSWGFGTWKDRYESMDVSWNPISEIRKDWKIYLKMLRYCTWILLLLEADKRGVLTAGDARVGGQMLLKGQMSVIPRFSHAKNIGLDGSGINCRYTPMGDGVDLSNCLSDMSFSNIDIDYQIIRALNNKISIPGTSLRAVLEGMGFMHFARKLKKNLIRINNDYLKKR